MGALVYNWKSLRKASFVILLLILIVFFNNVSCLRSNQSSISSSYYKDGDGYQNLKWSDFKSSPPNNEKTNKGSNSLESSSRGGLGLILLGYSAKLCFYFFTYFKLLCLCLFISTLFLLLCPLLPFLIPALLLILIVAAASSIAIPLISVAAAGGSAGGGDGGLTVISTGTGGGGGVAPPQFVSIPAF